MQQLLTKPTLIQLVGGKHGKQPILEVFWLDKGVHHIRVVITLQEYNLNWFQFDIVASDNNILLDNEIRVVPNPSSDFIKIKLPNFQKIDDIEIF